HSKWRRAMSLRHWNALVFLILVTLCVVRPVAAQVECKETPEGRVCTIRQPLIGGTSVLVPTQQALGLVTVGTGIGCSGTLVNRFWVLTADHCVARGIVGPPCGLSNAMADLPITAHWSIRRVIPTRLVRNWCGRGVDVALIFLGGGDF